MAPVINISNITKYGFDNLYNRLLKIKHIPKNKTSGTTSKYFQINEVLYIREIGIVITGIVRKGKICVDDKLLIGPFGNKFINIQVKSIHQKQIPIKELYKGDSGSLMIDITSDYIHSINKHMDIITEDQKKYYKSSIKIKLSTKITLSCGENFTYYCNNNIDIATIVNINRDIVKIEFIKKDLIRLYQRSANVILKNNTKLLFGIII
jgi:GTPase